MDDALKKGEQQGISAQAEARAAVLDELKRRAKAGSEAIVLGKADGAGTGEGQVF